MGGGGVGVGMDTSDPSSTSAVGDKLDCGKRSGVKLASSQQAVFAPSPKQGSQSQKVVSCPEV